MFRGFREASSTDFSQIAQAATGASSRPSYLLHISFLKEILASDYQSTTLQFILVSTELIEFSSKVKESEELVRILASWAVPRVWESWG